MKNSNTRLIDMNLPNKLTCLRILIIPFFVLCMLLPSQSLALKIISLVLFCGASVTDWFDGKIARKRNLVTNFGKFVDPLADKLLVTSAFICLCSTDRIAAWIVIIIIARELIITGLRTLAADNGIVIAASYWGKFKTASQMFAIIFLIMDFPGAVHIIGVVLSYIALVLTIISGVDYIIKNKKVLLKGGL